MKRLRTFALVATALLCVPAASADWLQEGGDAGGSGLLRGGGPDWPDVAFRIPAPEGLAWSNFNAPLKLGDSLIVATYANGAGGAGTRAFYKVDLLNGNVSVLVGQTVEPYAWASDGQLLFTVERVPIVPVGLPPQGNNLLEAMHLVARKLDGGEEAWRQPLSDSASSLVPARAGAGSAKIAVVDGHVFVALRTSGDPAAVALESRATATGSLDWAWRNTDGSTPPTSAYWHTSWLAGLTVTPTSVLVFLGYGDVETFGAADAGVPSFFWDGWVLDRDDGNLASNGGRIGYNPGAVGAFPSVNQPSRAAADANVLAFRSPANNEVTANPDVRLNLLPSSAPVVEHPGPFLEGVDGGVSAALDGHRVFYASTTRLYGLTYDLASGWDAEAPSGFRFAGYRFTAVSALGLLADGAYVYAATTHGSGSGVVEVPDGVAAYEATTGELAWSFGALGSYDSLMGGDGLIVACGSSELVVLGRTAASPLPIATISSKFPKPGEDVSLDLGGSKAGSGGQPNRFKVIWGDGAETDWQDAATLQHAYTTIGDQSARVMVQNPAGQTSSRLLTIHVGAHDPAVNIFNSPLSSEYQNTSFFLLGLLATGAAALFGIARAGRKRRRFHRELKGLEDDYARLHDDASGCDAMLAKRKSAARALFLEKRLEEAHASFLERRIDELRKGLRLGTIEDKLAFLPHGMVVSLQRLLADARVDQWERNHFIDALAKETDLSPAQRNTARKVIDDWFARDVGAKA